MSFFEILYVVLFSGLVSYLLYLALVYFVSKGVYIFNRPFTIKDYGDGDQTSIRLMAQEIERLKIRHLNSNDFRQRMSEEFNRRIRALECRNVGPVNGECSPLDKAVQQFREETQKKQAKAARIDELNAKIKACSQEIKELRKVK